MVGEELAKRVIEILNAGITIQDLALSNDARGLDVIHLTKEEKDKTLGRIILRPRNNTGALAVGAVFT